MKLAVVVLNVRGLFQAATSTKIMGMEFGDQPIVIKAVLIADYNGYSCGSDQIFF